MMATQSPTTPHSSSSTTQNRTTTGRRPLQPKNIPSDPIRIHILKPTPKQSAICHSNNNKENEPPNLIATTTKTTPVKMELLDASLAEELNAVRERLERLRLDKEKTEKMLKERDRMLDFKLMEMCERCEFQQELEIEVDRLYRLKQLQIPFKSMSPIRSLREKEMEKKKSKKEVIVMQTEESRSESKEDWSDESEEETPCSKINYSISGIMTPASSSQSSTPCSKITYSSSVFMTTPSSGASSSSKITCSTSEMTPKLKFKSLIR